MTPVVKKRYITLFISIPVIISAGLAVLLNTGKGESIQEIGLRIFGYAYRSTSQLSPASLTEKEIEEKIKKLTFEIEKLKLENNKLRKALSLKQLDNLDILREATVLFYNREPNLESMVIDIGKDKGVNEGDLVINPDGIVIGRIKQAGKQTSKLSIASNPDQIFEISIIPGNTNALAKGIGARTFLIEFIPRQNNIKLGSFASIISPFTANSLLLADIVDVQMSEDGSFQKAYAVLLAHPEKEKIVFVIVSKNFEY